MSHSVDGGNTDEDLMGDIDLAMWDNSPTRGVEIQGLLGNEHGRCNCGDGYRSTSLRFLLPGYGST